MRLFFFGALLGAAASRLLGADSALMGTIVGFVMAVGFDELERRYP